MATQDEIDAAFSCEGCGLVVCQCTADELYPSEPDVSAETCESVEDGE